MSLLRVTALLVAISLLHASNAYAVPAEIPYVGFLSDAQGPYDGEPVNIYVEIFAQGAGGEALWEAEYQSVPVEKGVFFISIGSALGTELDISLLPAAGAWLGFKVNGQPLAPRQAMLSTPYAVHAWQAETCDQAAALAPAAADAFATKAHNQIGRAHV